MTNVSCMNSRFMRFIFIAAADQQLSQTRETRRFSASFQFFFQVNHEKLLQNKNFFVLQCSERQLCCASAMNRAMSAEESTISQDSDSPPKKKTGEIKKEAGRTKSLEPTAVQDNYECSICLSWLKEPVLTSCGHRFCKSCLEGWRK